MNSIARVALLALALPAVVVAQDLNPRLGGLERDLGSEDPEIRIAAQHDLLGGAYRDVDPAALVSVLVRRLGAPIPESWDGPLLPGNETTFRGRLIEHLSTHYTSHADALLPEFLEVLADVSNSAYLRGSAAAALERIGPVKPEVVTALIDSIEDPLPRASTGVHDRAARALGSMGTAATSAVPALTDLLEHPFGMTQDEAFIALGRIAADGSALAMADHLDRVRRVDELDAGEASATLLALMSTPEAARSAVPSLVGLLEAQGDSYVQRAALRSLTAIRPKASPRLVAALLEAMIEDRSRQAEATLLQIKPDGPAPVELLAEAMGSLWMHEHADALWPQRVVLAHAIGRFGRDGAAATPTLTDGIRRGAPRIQLHSAAREEFAAHLSALAAVGEGDASAAEAVLHTTDAVAEGEFAAWGRTRLLEAFVGIGLPENESNRATLLDRIRTALETSDAGAKQTAAKVIRAHAHEFKDAEAAPLVPLLTRALDVELAPHTLPALGALGARAAPALPTLESIAAEELPSLFTNHRERERRRIARETIALIQAASTDK